MNLRWMRGMMTLAAWVAGVWTAAATEYSWTYAGNGNWNDTTKWSSSGYPGQDPGDTANFTAAAGRVITVNIDPVFSGFNVSGNGAWTWTTPWGTQQTLTIGTGNLIFSSDTTARSVLNVTLAGDAALIMNSGTLNLYSQWSSASTFSGGVYLNGGTLLGGAINVGGDATDLGTGTIYLGADGGAAADAEVRFANANTTPIFVRSGNDGVATLGTYYIYTALTVPSAITLAKDLVVVNDELKLGGNYGIDTCGLTLSGPISGTGTITKEGLGILVFSGVNSYSVAPTLRGGFVYLSNSGNSFAGPVTVERGRLLVLNDGALGHVDNAIRLGAPGMLGGFGVYANNVNLPIDRNIELTGNGGLLTMANLCRLQLNGAISGSAPLLLLGGGPGVTQLSALNGENTFSGGLIAAGGYWDPSDAAAFNRTVYGSGDIRILSGANLSIRGAENVHANATVTLKGGTLHVFTTDYLPKIATNSYGGIWMVGDSSAAMNTRLADASQPIGNGTLRLGSGASAFTFTGTSLAALAGHDPDRTYRLGNSYGAYTRRLILNAAGVDGALKDLNGQSYHVNVTGPQELQFYDDNPFSGTLTISGISLAGYTPNATGNPLGSDTGPVSLRSGKMWVINSAGVTRTLSKGTVTFNGASQVMIDRYSATPPAWISTLQLGGLQRENGSTLDIYGFRNDLGVAEKVMVTGGLTVNNGMVSPYLWNSQNLKFLTYDGTLGVTPSDWSHTDDLTGGAGSRVYLSGATVVPGGGALVHAVRANGALSGGTLTIGSGGLILSSASTHTAPLAFGSSEAVLHVTADTTLNGTLTTSGGLTKSGSGKLTLGANNTGALNGGIAVQQGILAFLNQDHLGGAGNVITLNGGWLQGPYDVTFANNIVVGAAGGTLYSGIYSGNISGNGHLNVTGGWPNRVTFAGVNNTFSGGSSMADYVTVAAGSSLGTGPITVTGALILQGAGNTRADQRLALVSAIDGARVLFLGGNHAIGEISGNGYVAIGRTYALSVGGLNTDAEYFGIVLDYSDHSAFYSYHTAYAGGKLIKDGTGTFTLWGECWHTGGTVVTNGTLVVNNWMNPAGGVTVHAGATLDGIGTVGVVNNQGGTVKGSLITSGLSWGAGSVLQVALNGAGAGEYDVLTVNGAVALSGALSIDLNYMPAMGQTFTILANDGTDPITGAFDSDTVNVLYNGAVVRFQVNYNSGDGNDLVLERVPVGTVIMVR